MRTMNKLEILNEIKKLEEISYQNYLARGQITKDNHNFSMHYLNDEDKSKFYDLNMELIKFN